MSAQTEDRMLTRIQKLIDKAYGNTTEEEKKSLLAKADELMVKFSIEQFQLQDPNRPNTAPNVKGSQPELRHINFTFREEGDDPLDWDVKSAMKTMFHGVCEHLFVRIGSINSEQAHCVGYPADLDFLEMYFLGLKMHIVANLSPSVDPEITWQENLHPLKMSGRTWEAIHYKLMNGHPDYPYKDQQWERKIGVRFTAEYKKQEGNRRVTPTNMRVWRTDFISGYVRRLQQRLIESRRETIRQNENLPALIADKKSVVDEALWAQFPDLRPCPEGCQCDKCHICSDKECQRVRCRRSRMPAPRVRYRNLNTSAYNAGTRIANTADIGGGNRISN